MDRGQLIGPSLRGLPKGNLEQSLGLLSIGLPSPMGDAMGLLADGMGYAKNPSSLTPGAGLLSLAGLIPGVPPSQQMKAGMRVIRPRGWNAASEAADELSRKGHLYRGMTKQEFEATIGSGGAIRSRGDFSAEGEGTNFSDRFSDAESYVNFGRTDPRKTGEPTYVVEIIGDGISRSKDGYYKAPEVPSDRITSIWEMVDMDGEVVARKIR